MSSVPIRERQLGLKKASRPESADNKGFRGNKESTSHMGEDWGGKVKGKTKHTYKAGD